MRVLVTGSSGQVGSFVVDALRAEGHETVGVDIRPSPWTDAVADVRSLPADLEWDAVVHCAAQVSVPSSILDPRHDAAHNVDGTLSVLDAARRVDATRVVFISSAAVYGNVATLPIREDAATDPRSPYGFSKLTAEGYVRLYGELHGIPAAILRPFNIFSRRQDPSNGYSGVLSRMGAAARAGRQPEIHGDGEQTRDFVHVSDVIAAVLIALESSGAVGGTFNVGTGKASSVLEVARTIWGLAGAPFEPRYVKARDGDIRHSVADVTRLRALGYAPRTDLALHLRELLDADPPAEASASAHTPREEAAAPLQPPLGGVSG